MIDKALALDVAGSTRMAKVLEEGVAGDVHLPKPAGLGVRRSLVAARAHGPSDSTPATLAFVARGSRWLLVLLAASLSLGCESAFGVPSPTPDFPSEREPRAPARVAELSIERRVRPASFTRGPFFGLTRIDAWSAPDSERWPPLNSKHGYVVGGGNIWSSSILPGPEYDWHPSPIGWIGQPLDRVAAGLKLPPAGRQPQTQPLGVVGDQLISARSVDTRDAEGYREERDVALEFYAAELDDLHHPWPLGAYDWPESARNRELSVWYQGVGPALAGEELVLLGEHSVLHGWAPGGQLEARTLDHEPRWLSTGLDGRAAWHSWSAETREGHLHVALDHFGRILELPKTGHAMWAGDSLILEREGQVLRWTEDRTVELELPGLDDLDLDRWWFGDGEIVWIFALGRPLARVDARGHVMLDIELDWPFSVGVGHGRLIWEVVREDRMDVYTTLPGAGFELDRGLFEPG